MSDRLLVPRRKGAKVFAVWMDRKDCTSAVCVDGKHERCTALLASSTDPIACRCECHGPT